MLRISGFIFSILCAAASFHSIEIARESLLNRHGVGLAEAGSNIIENSKWTGLFSFHNESLLLVVLDLKDLERLELTLSFDFQFVIL